MRLVKLGIISIACFSLLLTTITLLMPSSVFVSRSIRISAPKDSVYIHLNDLKKWKQWCANMDSATITYPGATTGQGAVANVGKTTIIINSVKENSISATWQTGSTRLECSFNFLPDKNFDEAMLQWQFINHVKWYPWEKFAAIFSDKSIGNFMEKSLDKMKLAEEQAIVNRQ